MEGLYHVSKEGWSEDAEGNSVTSTSLIKVTSNRTLKLTRKTEPECNAYSASKFRMAK